VYEPEGIEVEFVRASGRTQALVELTLADVRAIEDEDSSPSTQLKLPNPLQGPS